MAGRRECSLFQRVGRRGMWTGVAVLALSTVPVHSAGPSAASGQAAGAADRHEQHAGIALPRLADVNPHPDVVEVHLEARVAEVELVRGVRSEVWTYNGTIPGPMIEAKVGDTLVVHFTNRLPEPTTIHWHGVETPADMDGSNISQLTVPANGGTFRYEFKLLRAATHWYHPHVRSNEQVEKGLAGPLVIRDPREPRALRLQELTLVLDDVLLDQAGRIAEFATDPDAVMHPLDRALEQVNGREGNTLLVNGRVKPTVKVRCGVPLRLRLINAANARFMRVSVAGHTLYRIGGDGGLIERPIPIPPVNRVPDPDHRGRHMSNPDESRGLLLVPGERADVVLVPKGKHSREIAVEWHDIARGRHRAFYTPAGTIGLAHAHDDGRRAPATLMKLRLTGGRDDDDEDDGDDEPDDRRRRRRAADKDEDGDDDGDDDRRGCRCNSHGWRAPRELRHIERLDPAGAALLPVRFGHTPPDADGHVTFFAAMKDKDGDGTLDPLPFDEVSPADAADVMVWETRVWEVVNMTGGDHPFHPHGFFFQPLEIQYVDLDRPDNNRVVRFRHLENKDSIRVPRRPGAAGRSMTILRAVTRFDDVGREGRVAAEGKQPGPGRSGGWLFHCHILEHADRGMMSFLELRAPEFLVPPVAETR